MPRVRSLPLLLVCLSLLCGLCGGARKSHDYPALCSSRAPPAHVSPELYSAVCKAELNGRYCYGAGPERVCLPGLVGVGFEKCASTKFFDLLLLHPEVCGSKIKEARLLFKVPQWPALLREQLNGSEGGEGGCLHAEYTPGYVAPYLLDEALTMIKDAKLLLPRSTQFVAGLRDPVDRAHSQFSYHLKKGMDCVPHRPCFKSALNRTSSFRDAVCFAVKHLGGEAWLAALAQDPSVYPYAFPNRSATYPHWDILSPGFFIELLRPWTSRLGRSRFFVFDKEELTSEPQKLMQRAFAFLGLPELDLSTVAAEQLSSLSRNSRNSSHELAEDPEVRRFLQALYSNSTTRTNAVFGLRLPAAEFQARDLDYQRLCKDSHL